MSLTKTTVRDDALAYAQVMAKLLRATDSAVELALAARFEQGFADLMSEVPARRGRIIRDVIASTGHDAPDEADLVGHLTREVLEADDEFLRRLSAAVATLRVVGR